MQNPFESGHIKNYILLYASVVVIMVLFFIASTIFRENEDVEKKVFQKQINKPINEMQEVVEKDKEEEPTLSSKIKLMDRAY